MIWFIVIYIVTIILEGVFFYFDMDKGETLEQYFENCDTFLFIIAFLFPVINTGILILLAFSGLFQKIWNKIKHWKK